MIGTSLLLYLVWIAITLPQEIYGNGIRVKGESHHQQDVDDASRTLLQWQFWKRPDVSTTTTTTAAAASTAETDTSSGTGNNITGQSGGSTTVNTTDRGSPSVAATISNNNTLTLSSYGGNRTARGQQLSPPPPPSSTPEALSCPSSDEEYPPPTLFDTSVVVIMEGRDLDRISSAQLDEVGGLIKEFYNETNFDDCDPGFRRIHTVYSNPSKLSVDEDVFYARYQFNVTASCYGCNVLNGTAGEYLLFTDDNITDAESSSSDEDIPVSARRAQRELLSFGHNKRGAAAKSNDVDDYHSRGSRRLSSKGSSSSSKGSSSRSKGSSSSSKGSSSRSKGGSSSSSKSSGSNDDDAEDVVPLDTASQIAAGSRRAACTCTSPFPHRRPPTQSELVSAMNDEIETGSAASFEIESVTQARPVACNATVSNFTSYVVVAFVGNGTILSDDEVATLEIMFLESYNELNFQNCDIPHFRTVTEVLLFRREVFPNSLGVQTFIEFEVHGECRECDDFHLQLFTHIDVNATNMTEAIMRNMDTFTNTNYEENANKNGNVRRYNKQRQRRVQDEEESSSSDGEGSSSSSSPICFCPASSANTVGSAPTSIDFVDIYHDRMLDAKVVGNFPDLVLVEDVIEVDEVACHPEQSEFTSLVWVNLQHSGGTAHLLSDSEILSCESAFREVYNQWTLSACDSHFKGISDVVLHLDDARVQQELARGNTQRARGLQTTTEVVTNELPALFEVRGSCRNCPRSNPTSTTGSLSLFDDSFGRRLDQIEVSSYSGSMSFLPPSMNIPEEKNRNLVLTTLSNSNSTPRDEGVCICPVNRDPTQPSSPSQTRIFDLYNERLTELTDFGLLENVDEMTDSPPRVRCSTDTTLLTDAFEVDYDIINPEAFRDFLFEMNDDSAEALFEQYYLITHDEIQQTLCDPFNRTILDISCVPIDNPLEASFAMCCEVTFTCVGPCQDWLFPEDLESTSVHNLPGQEYEIFNCTCLDSEARAPSEEEIFEGVAVHLGDVLNFVIPLNHASECFRPATVVTSFRIRYALPVDGGTGKKGSSTGGKQPKISGSDSSSNTDTIEISQKDYQGVLDKTNKYFSDVFARKFDGKPEADFLHFTAIVSETKSFANPYEDIVEITYDANIVYTINSTVPSKEETDEILENADMLKYLFQIWDGRESVFDSTIAARFAP